MSRRSRLLRRWIRRREKEKGCRTIGIIGSGRGVGVTHTALMLAGFLSGNTDGTIAVVELNRSEDFRRLYWQWGMAEGSCQMTAAPCRRVFLYSDCSREDIAEVMNESYQYVIFDFGDEWEWQRDELLRCDCKIAVASTREWQMEQTETFIKKIKQIKGQEKWTYLSVFGNSGTAYGFRTLEMEARLFRCPDSAAMLFGSIF